MRQKTYYSQQPDEVSFAQVGDSMTVFFRDSIEEIPAQDEDRETQWSADEYAITIPYADGMEERISGNLETWLTYVKDLDYDKEAKTVRSKRNKLLEESDKEMLFDRADFEIPTSDRFADWLPILKIMANVVKGDWAAYRQQLRDIPQQQNFPYDVEFPEKPED